MTARIFLATGLSTLTLSAGAAAPAYAAGPAPFVSHQAIYDLALTKSRRSPSIEGVRGRIVYVFSGNACEGYTTDFRQVSQIDSGDGKGLLSDLRSSTWEEGDGKTYRFKVESRTNDAAAAVVEGTATRGDKGVALALTRPRAKTLNLDADIVFPTEQIRRIVEAAKAGQSLLQLRVYDGSDNGEKVYSTLTVIGQPVPAETMPNDSASGNAALTSVTRWPVTVSYYDRDKANADAPVYAMSFELYENGVSRALTLDYNDFVVGGEMSKFDVKDAKACER